MSLERSDMANGIVVYAINGIEASDEFLRWVRALIGVAIEVLLANTILDPIRWMHWPRVVDQQVRRILGTTINRCDGVVNGIAFPRRRKHG